MKTLIKKFFDNEVLSYLFFGVAATLVYMTTRLLIFALTGQTLFATITANVTAVLFAFITNDIIVFKQERKNWPKRLVKFSLARLSTFLLDLLFTFLFVTQFPHIIGQFVNENLDKINAIETVLAQISIIILNYILSKLYIFKK